MFARLKRKYWKPKSVAWLASVPSLASGGFIALEPVHKLTDWVDAVTNMTGGMPAYSLIMAGLVGIGLRGKDE